MIERHPPTRNVLEVDLCDHFHYAKGYRCQSYWTTVLELFEPVEVKGKTMFGTYPAGTWKFCNMHARIFARDRLDSEPPGVIDLPT